MNGRSDFENDYFELDSEFEDELLDEGQEYTDFEFDPESATPPKPGRALQAHPRSVFLDEPVTFASPARTRPQHGTEYIRRVQSMLNDVLGLRLPVTGIMDAASRSALRSFQRQQGRPVDGMAGPEIEQALMEASDISSGLQSEFEDGMGETEWEHEAAKRRSAFRYVKSFAGSDADCSAAMKIAEKTRSQALAIINTQIGQAIRMLRIAANKLKRGSRSTQTKAIFQKIFRVKPEFVPTWLKQTEAIKDRGDVVATRCRGVANLLERGRLRYFCTIRGKYCSDCPDGHDYSTTYACSSWGDESVAPRNSRVICLNKPFWQAMGATPIDIPTILAVLMHEPFHVYYGKYVTRHDRANPGKFGAIYCTTQFVFEVNGRTNYPAWMKKICEDIHVRR